MSLTFNQMCSILCKRYRINAAEARENVSLDRDCGFLTKDVIKDADSYNRWLDEMEERGGD